MSTPRSSDHSSSISADPERSVLLSERDDNYHAIDGSLHHLAISVGLVIGSALGGASLTSSSLNAVVTHFVSALMEAAPLPSPEWLREVVDDVLSTATTELALDVPLEVRDQVDTEVIAGIDALKEYICVELEERRESTREGRLKRNVLRKKLWGDPLSVVAVGLKETFWDRYAGAKAALYRSDRSVRSDGRSSDAEVRVPTPSAEGQGTTAPDKLRVAPTASHELQREQGAEDRGEFHQRGVSTAKLEQGQSSQAKLSCVLESPKDPVEAERARPPVHPYDDRALMIPSVPRSIALVANDLTEAALEKIRKSARSAKAPPGAPIRVGGSETLSSFRVYYRDQAMINGWSEIHEFYWLAHHIESKLWLQISRVSGGLLPNPLSRACYVRAAAFVWASLERRFGASKEIEQLQAESLTMAQRPSEKVMAYLGRVSDYRSRCHYARVVRSDSEWIAAARSGIQDALMRRLSYLPVDPQLREEGAGVEGAPIGEWEAWLISMEQLTVNEVDHPGTEAVQAFETQAGAKGGGPRRAPNTPFRGRCFRCRQLGHRIADCPQKEEEAENSDRRRGAARTESAAAEATEETSSSEQASQPGQEERSSPTEDCTVQTSTFAVDCHYASGSSKESAVRSWAVAEGDSPPVLQLDFGGHVKEGLVDTGSATSLVDRSTADFLSKLGHAVWVPTQLRVTIKYADAREDSALGEVILRAAVKGSICYFPCLVVERLGRPIILGRRSLKLLGTELKFKQEPEAVRDSLREAFRTAGEKIVSAHVEAQCVQLDVLEAVECYVTNGELFLEDGPGEAQLREPSIVGRDVIDRKVRPKLWKMVEAGVHSDKPDELVSHLLREVSELGELSVAEGYTLKLKKLQENEPEPTEEGQEFRFLASWKVRETKGTSAGAWNSASLIHRLEQQEREEFQQNCDYYVSKGFWKEKVQEGPRGEPQTTSPLVGVIFPVKQDPAKSTAVRPVCDLRPVNAISPVISNTQLTTSEAVMRLRSRLRPSHEVAQYDLQKAFYSIEVDISDAKGLPVPLELSVGGAVYETRRLAFGLSCGPLILNSSQRVDLRVVECAYEILYGEDKANPPPNVVVVMDDFVLTGTRIAIDRFEKLLLCCWQKTGFRCPGDKRVRWGSLSPVRWLGGYWKWSADSGELSLRRPEVNFQEQFVDASSASGLTKRLVFKHGGQFIGISCGVGETLARSHADCARVIASRAESWDQKGGDWTREAWLHLSLACRYWEKARAEEDDSLPLYTTVPTVRAEIDASGVGFGYVWKDGSNGKVLACGARIQSRSMSVGSWHVNRRELYAIAWCLQRLEDCLVFFPSVTSIQLLSDSAVAVKQSDVWIVPRCKSVERKAILRLRGVICDVVHGMSVRSPAVEVTTGHISGSSNKIADALSRSAVTKKFIDVPLGCSEEATVECQFTEVHSWLYEGGAGSLSLPSFRDWLTMRDAFRGWKRQGPDLTDDMPFRDWMLLRQEEDELCATVRDQVDDDGYVEAPGLEYGYQMETNGLVYRLRPPGAKDVDDGPKRQLVLPQSIVVEFALAVHQQCGHAGVSSTMAVIYQAAWAKHLHKAVKKAVRGCLSCALTREGGRVQTRMGACKMPRRCFEVMGADLYGPLKRPTELPDERRVRIRGVDPPRESSYFILTVVDRLSPYTFYRLLSDGKAETIARELELIFLSIGRFPRELWVDNGQSFVGSVALSALCLSVGTSLRCIPFYTPSVGGWWERHHRELGSTLRSALHNTPTASWRLLTALGQLRTNQRFAHKLIFGYDPSVPTMEMVDSISDKQLPERFPKKKEAMTEAKARARRRDDALVIFEEIWLGRRAEAAEYFQGKVTAVDATNPVKPGDSVILFGGRQSSKLSPRASGPYVVLRAI
ncbi:hypothetical protein FOL47_005418, partial [Perkinsus chesapeaki]